MCCRGWEFHAMKNSPQAWPHSFTEYLFLSFNQIFIYNQMEIDSICIFMFCIIISCYEILLYLKSHMWWRWGWGCKFHTRKSHRIKKKQKKKHPYHHHHSHTTFMTTMVYNVHHFSHFFAWMLCEMLLDCSSSGIERGRGEDSMS